MEKVKVPKAHWDTFASKMFCEICRDEVLAENRPTAALSTLGYKNLEEKFFAKTGRKYDHLKLKNRWDTLKVQYNLWKELKHAATGLGFDVTEELIIADDDWWKEKIELNKEYGKFRYSPIENLNELEVMFQNIHVSGASSVIPGVSKDNYKVKIAINIQEVYDEDDDANLIVLEEPNTNGKQRAATITPSPKKNHRNPMVKEVRRLVDKIDNIESSSSVTSQQNNKADDEIIEHLCLAVRCGATEGSDEHYIATKLFIKQHYCAVFRSFETNEGRMSWLRRMYEDRKKN